MTLDELKYWEKEIISSIKNAGFGGREDMREELKAFNEIFTYANDFIILKNMLNNSNKITQIND